MASLHPIGLTGLIEHLGLPVDPPAVRSVCGAAARRTEVSADEVRETYPPRLDCHTLRDHLRFALRYEPLDLRVWKAILGDLPITEIEEWVRENPSSGYARRAWFLYEMLTGRELDLPGRAEGPYVNLGDSNLQFTWVGNGEEAPHSRRHRVRNNLLGTRTYCPVVRATRRLQDHQENQYGEQVRKLTLNADPLLFRRAADYLYLSETKSSYAIEGEKPSADRARRFVLALEQAGESDIASEAGLVALQQRIVQDPRFVATGWRRIQNYVGRTRLDFSEDVQYACPKPGDLPELMSGWIEMVRRFQEARETDPVVLAACASFGFVYLHPFEDGNGRLHRFVIHRILAERSYSPPGVIFPVSAVMHRRRNEYETVLQNLSRQVMPHIEYQLDDHNRMTVTNDTIDLYRYPDLTSHAEFLYDSIAETVEEDWPRELDFLAKFDRAFRAVQEVVDMPDAKVRLMVRLLMQNQGRLASGKRQLFAFLSDSEVRAIEQDARIALGFAEPGEDGISGV